MTLNPMYTSYFGLRENPFNLTPDPRYLFLSPQHSEALNHLIYGINEKKGFIMITGGIGTGKTTICRLLLSTLDQSVASALIFNPSISEIELLAIINQEFKIKSRRGRPTKRGYVDALNKFLLKNFAAGRNAVLLIDEAQNLSLNVLEQIRMLSNLETETEKLLQIVLLGQPELQELIASPSLKQLSERVTVRYNLKPLDQKDIQNYIEHRLTVAGGNSGRLKFSNGACKTIYEYSMGIPRRINAICDRALLIAYTMETFSIDKKIIKKAVGDIGRGYFTGKSGLNDKKMGLLFILILFLFAVLALGSIIFRGDFFRLFQS